MRIALSPQQYFSLDGKPLVAGRLKVHLHDSDTLATLYTLEGGSYVQASNPVVLDDAGEVHDTRWADMGLYDVDVEQRNDDGTFVKIAEFQFGLELPEATNDTVLNGIDALHHADPSLNVVSVYGYDAQCVAPMRQYIWDPTCTAQGDDGVVVASDVADTGRWILLWPDEKLPCTVYGIVPGREQGMDAFLSYPETVGQWNIATPPVVRFVKGDYTINANFATNKAMFFDNRARFVNNVLFTCPTVDVEFGKSPSYVANFSILDTRTPVHSSWFKSLSWFLSCGSKHLICDQTNYFTDTSVSGTLTVTHALIEGTGDLAMNTGANGSLVLDGCTITAKGIFAPNQTYVFKNMRWNDAWWTTNVPGAFGFGEGSYIDFSPTDNFWNIADFGLVELYVRLLRAYNITTLDLCGRSITSLANAGFTSIKNGHVGSLTSNASIALTECTVDSLSMTAGDLVMARCSATIAQADCTSITADDCNIVLSVDLDPTVTAVYVRGGSWTGNIQANNLFDLSKGKQVSFTNTVVTAPSLVASNLLSMDGCTVHCPVVAYPVLVDSKYYMNFSFTRNTLRDGAYIKFNYSGTLAAIALVDVHDVEIVRLRITDNQFLQADQYGIKCPFYNADKTYRFFRGLGDGSMLKYFTYEYWGNSGSCPLACPPCKGNNSVDGPSFYFPVWSAHYFIGTAPLTQRVFCLPALYTDGDPGETTHQVGKPGQACACANSVTYATNGFVQDIWDDSTIHTMSMTKYSFLLPAVCLDTEHVADDAFTVYYAMRDMEVDTFAVQSFVTPAKIDVPETAQGG